MYIINYYNGQPSSIQKDKNMSIPFDVDNKDFVEFLKWNALQKVPLDYETPIEVELPEPVETLEQKIAKEVKKQLKKAK